jgi:DNA-binding GntR family transcriptional regulator
VTRLSQEDAYDLGYARALLEGFAITVGHARFDAQTFDRLEAYLVQMATCRIPQDVPELVQIDLAFHRLLVEQSGSVRLLDLWSSLNGQIGALFIRGIERQHADVEAVVAMHRDLLDAMRSSDPAVIQQAVLHHYVRSSPAATQLDPLVQQAIQTLAPSYIAVQPNATDDDTYS